MLVKYRYIGAFHKIRRRYKIRRRCGDARANYVVKKNATLEESIVYTEGYVVGIGMPHYRYDYYRDALEKAAKEFDCIHPGRKIVHVDLGCGPGLFSWVVHDYVMARYRKKNAKVRFYMYDHAESMIKLTKIFWKNLSVQRELNAYHDVDGIRKGLRSEDLSDCDVLVSFGYVLIQTHGEERALSEFACIIRELFPSGSCTMVAVDAHVNKWRRDEFRNSCRHLFRRLRALGVGVEEKMGSQRSCMYARLTGGTRECTTAR